MNNKILKYLLLLFIAILFTACGTYDTSADKNKQLGEDKSGSAFTAVSFSLAIDESAKETQTEIPSPLAGEGQGGGKTARTLAKLDCTTTSITTIEIAVYDSTGTELVKKSFNCTAHSGNIEVPSGGNRKFVFSGKNSSEVEVYRGEQNSVIPQDSPPINLDEVKLEKLHLSPPTSVTATAGDGQNTISWNTVTGATGYNIYWSTAASVLKSTGTKISNVKSPYLHTGLTNGTTYRYVVTAVNSYGESGESAEVTVTPQAPIPLPKTGQTTCYDSSGNVIACAGTGQDGELQRGVAWPNPRFTDNGDSTVTDTLTGLVWTKDGNAPGPAACSKNMAGRAGLCSLPECQQLPRLF